MYLLITWKLYSRMKKQGIIPHITLQVMELTVNERASSIMNVLHDMMSFVMQLLLHSVYMVFLLPLKKTGLKRPLQEFSVGGKMEFEILFIA